VIGLVVAASCYTDAYYPISFTAYVYKFYVNGLIIAAIDLYFSGETVHVPTVTFGWFCWFAQAWGGVIIASYIIGEPIERNYLTSVTPYTMMVELVRYVANIVLTSTFGDFIFSPLHRLSHRPAVYKDGHKEHHNYTRSLTSYVLFHATSVDNIVMSASVNFGNATKLILLSYFGWHQGLNSNFVAHLSTFHLYMSHGHDIRCASLLTPMIPDSMNFTAYHYVHHLNPNNNFGLTRNSDKLWDYIFGVNTIRTFKSCLKEVGLQEDFVGGHEIRKTVKKSE